MISEAATEASSKPKKSKRTHDSSYKSEHSSTVGSNKRLQQVEKNSLSQEKRIFIIKQREALSVAQFLKMTFFNTMKSAEHLKPVNTSKNQPAADTSYIVKICKQKWIFNLMFKRRNQLNLKKHKKAAWLKQYNLTQ